MFKIIVIGIGIYLIYKFFFGFGKPNLKDSEKTNTYVNPEKKKIDLDEFDVEDVDFQDEDEK
ncbi:MAG: hypothetical protein DWQ06_03335 [Calditrichaeota bacterium]|nr:MAG: hypothetical protein DWQ06_03335 [Calditrichota bacterium]